MKKLLLILTLIASTFFANAQENNPSKEETIKYIEKVFNDTHSFSCNFSNGNKATLEDFVYKGTTYSVFALICNDKNLNGRGIMAFQLKANNSKSFNDISYIFSRINWANLISIEDDTTILPNSPAKNLIITFSENSLIESSYISNETTDKMDYKAGVNQPSNIIYFPYLNQDGVKGSIIKALNHLADLERAEQKANNPFSN